MEQSISEPDYSGEPPRTELQKRVDSGEAPRTILEELYQRLQGRLKAHIRKWVKDAGGVEDVLQTVFLKMNIGFDDMIAREPVDKWIFTVANHEVVNHFRDQTRRPLPGLPEVPESAEAEMFEHDWDDMRLPDNRRRPRRPDEQAETWVGSVEPVLAHLRALVARGSLGNAQLDDYWSHVGEGVPQAELAKKRGLTQGRISQRNSAVQREVRISLYLCDILGLVRPPHREAEIREHLDRFDQAIGLTAADRALLRRAGCAVRRDHDQLPVLRRDDAQAAIQERGAEQEVTLEDLHDSESAYATAIGNPAPRCIEAPCAVHTASGA